MNAARLCILAFLILVACSAEDGAFPGAMTNGPPLWSAGYPLVATGAISVDLNLQADRPCNIHYVIATREQGFSAKQIISRSNQAPSGAVIAAGIIAFSGSDPVQKVLPLDQNKDYHAYFVAQNIGDTLYLPQPEYFHLRTASRQDTVRFFSRVENRDVQLLVYRPELMLKYPGTEYPVCVFLGSESEVAPDGNSINLIRNGTLPAAIHSGRDLPCMVVSPQHISEQWDPGLIHEVVRFSSENYPADVTRMYMTGIGSGAYATWKYASAFPGSLAAIVPVSGDAPASGACSLAGVSIWAFHNEVDYVVAPDNALGFVSGINECSTVREIKASLFPDPGHNCWKRVYDPGHPDWSRSPGIASFDVFQWLLTQSRD